MMVEADVSAIKEFLMNNDWKYYPDSCRFEKLSEDEKTVHYIEINEMFNEDWED